jgi:hypothetical protein
MKNKGYSITLAFIAYILISSLIISAEAQPYYDAYFTNIMVTNGNDTIELISGGTAKVYDGQVAWKNLTFYNERCGTFGGNLYTEIYANDALIGTSSERYVWRGSYGSDNWYSAESGPSTLKYTVKLWWDSSGTFYLEDVSTFYIKVVKLFVSNWSPSVLTVEKGKTTASTLSTSFKNGGNDYMYGAKISVVDSAGLEISPQSQTLQDIASEGTKSTSFSVTSPITATTGTKSVSFKIEYNDFRGAPHSETKTALITVGKLGTDITLSLLPSSLKKSSSTTITAKLVDGNDNPLTNKNIDFYLGTTSLGSSITDSSGNAVKTYTANLDAGTYVVNASYSGSIDYGSSSATSNLIVSPFATTLTIDVPSATQGKPTTLKATLKDENGNPIQNANIDFQLNDGNSWGAIGSDITDSSGVASIPYTPSSIGAFQVKAVFSGTTNYSQSTSTTGSLSVGNDYTLYYIGGGIIAVAAIGIVGYMVFQRRKKAVPPSPK